MSGSDKRYMKSLPVVAAGCLVLLTTLCSASYPKDTSCAPQRMEGTCPSVEIFVPKYAVSARAPLPLSFLVGDAKKILGEDAARKIKVTWSSSYGSIVSAAGDDQVFLDATNVRLDGDLDVRLSVAITGTPPECTSSLHRELKINGTCQPPKLADDYGGVTADVESKHLDALGRILTGDTRVTAYVVAYEGANACYSEAQWRSERARYYLMQKWRIPGDRITAIDGGYRADASTELYLGDRDYCGPMIRLNNPPEERRITGSCKNKFPDDLL